MVQEVDCPYCGSKHLHKVAPRMTATRGLVKRYQCQDCGKYFQGSYRYIIAERQEYTVVTV